MFGITFNPSDKVWHAFEGTATDSLLSDQPEPAFNLIEPVGKGAGVSQHGMLAEKRQLTGRMGLGQCLEETPPKQTREYPHRQKETGPTGDPALPVG